MTDAGLNTIDPYSIRVGDRVRRTVLTPGSLIWKRDVRDVLSAEFVVQRIMDPATFGGIYLRFTSVVGNEYVSISGSVWEILERAPEAPREPWSRWRDPLNGTEYARTDEAEARNVHYVAIARRGVNSYYNLAPDRHGDIISRLVPIEG